MIQRILLWVLTPLVLALVACGPPAQRSAAVHEDASKAVSAHATKNKKTAGKTAGKKTAGKPTGKRDQRGRKKARALKIVWTPASKHAYERAHRPNSQIRRIIIHVAQAPARSVVHTFKNGNAQASAQYVVSSAGRVFHMVPNRSIAWHSGNRFYNATSIGIEHAGYVQKKKSLTERMYRASARLVAHLAHKYRIPLDRKHVIGHNEVPDPNHPRLHGGFDHHTDPGPHWKWGEYMRYARAFEHGADKAPHKKKHAKQHTHKKAPKPKVKHKASVQSKPLDRIGDIQRGLSP